MKRCTHCGSVSPGSEKVCGVCGASIAETDDVGLEKAIRTKKLPTDIGERASRVPALSLLAGSILIAVGIVGLFFLGPISIVFLMAGIVAALVGIVTMGDRVIPPGGARVRGKD